MNLYLLCFSSAISEIFYSLLFDDFGDVVLLVVFFFDDDSFRVIILVVAAVVHSLALPVVLLVFLLQRGAGTIVFADAFVPWRGTRGGWAGRGGCGRMGGSTTVRFIISGSSSATSSQDRGNGRGGRP